MKESTKLILMFGGAGAASYLLLSDPVASATESHPMVAAGGEGLVALGGAYGAWKLKGGKRVASAIVGGIGVGLLVNSIRAGLSKPAASPPTPLVIAQPVPTPSVAVGEPTPAPSIAVGEPSKTTPLLTSSNVIRRPVTYSSPPIVAPKQEYIR